MKEFAMMRVVLAGLVGMGGVAGAVAVAEPQQASGAPAHAEQPGTYREELEALRSAPPGASAWEAVRKARELLLKAAEEAAGDRAGSIPWRAVLDEGGDPAARELALRWLEVLRKGRVSEVVATIAGAGRVGRPMPTDDSLIENDLSDLRTVRELCRINVMEMRLAAEEGRWDAWVERADAFLKIGRLYAGTDSEIIGYNVGAAVTSLTLEELERALVSGKVPGPTLARIAGVIEAGLPLPRPGVAVQGARLMSLGSIASTYKVEHLPGMAPKQEAVAKAEELYQNVGRVAKLGFPQRQEDPFQFAEFEKTLDGRQHRVLALTLPSVEKLFEVMDRVDAESAGVTLMVALERYRLKHGQYPDSADLLVPDFVGAVPLDPFTGRAMLYKGSKAGPLEGGRAYLVYSAGFDQKDDGGRQDSKDPMAGASGRGRGFDLVVNPGKPGGE